MIQHGTHTHRPMYTMTIQGQRILCCVNVCDSFSMYTIPMHGQRILCGVKISDSLSGETIDITVQSKWFVFLHTCTRSYTHT